MEIEVFMPNGSGLCLLKLCGVSYLGVEENIKILMGERFPSEDSSKGIGEGTPGRGGVRTTSGAEAEEVWLPESAEN